eukprot:9400818-Pyramimonas_sp.AAC.1
MLNGLVRFVTELHYECGQGRTNRSTISVPPHLADPHGILWNDGLHTTLAMATSSATKTSKA